MPSNSRRPRRQWFAAAALTALCVLALAACGRDGYPNSTFHRTTEFNTAISSLWDRLLFLGTVVFVIVEGLLVYTVVRFRSKPAAVVEAQLGEGGLNLISDCRRAADVAGGAFKFTVTSPYMLARTLLDRHYGDFAALTLAIADVLAAQVRDLPCECHRCDGQ